MGIFLCGFVPAVAAATFIAWWFIYHNVFYPKTCEKWDDEKKTWFNNGNKVALALHNAGDGWLGVVSWIILVVCGAVALVFAGWMTWTATHIGLKYQEIANRCNTIIMCEENATDKVVEIKDIMEELEKIKRRTENDNIMWMYIYNPEITKDLNNQNLDSVIFQFYSKYHYNREIS